ncbi:MAG: Gfo/Idh/MocA family protein [Planctomycetota bacterium]|jgi:predicted dehydrogenase
MAHNRSNRRQFVKRSLAVAGSAAVPLLWARRLQSGEPAGERLRVGCIGVGGRGTLVGTVACGLGEKIACADVDRDRAERFAGGGKCAVYTDYRKLLDRNDVDVVTVGTPDHWHTRVVIDAVKAGKDVYSEKPLTLTIDEGKKLCQAVKHSGRVVQVGTQQRSSAQFLMAVAIAQSGRLGKVLKSTCYIGAGPAGGPFPTADPPPNLNWDVWLGQCPQVPYTPQRCHGAFRWWLEYSGGKLTDWGAHHLDIAQWALGYDQSGPVEIAGRGEFPMIPDDFDPVAFFAGKARLPNGFNTATQFEVTLRFASGSTMVVTHGPGNGIMIEGEKGRIYVNRARLSGKPIEDLTKADHDWLAEETVRLYKGKPIDASKVTTDAANTGRDQATVEHMRNLFACVKDRSLPVSDVFTHHRAVSSCHLSNIAMLLGRKLQWDPAEEDFVGDEQASALVARPQRPPYTIEV